LPDTEISISALTEELQADSLIVDSNGVAARQTPFNLAQQLLTSGPLEAALTAKAESTAVTELTAEVAMLRSLLTTGLCLAASWQDLSALTPAAEGTGGEVAEEDDGTHGAASATGYDGETIPNSGRYRWHIGWGRWIRICATGLSAKADRAELDKERQSRQISEGGAERRAEALGAPLSGHLRAYDFEPDSVIDFTTDNYARRSEDGLLRNVGRDAVIHFTRDSSAAFCNRAGHPCTAPNDIPAFDWSQGQRAVLCLPAEASRSADRIRLLSPPAAGQILIDFHYDSADANGRDRGLFSICRTESELQGISVFCRSAGDYLTLQRRGPTHNLRTTISTTLLSKGWHRLYLSWDLVGGVASYSLDGAAIIHLAAPPGWTMITPTCGWIGRQETAGSQPREFNGLISRVFFLSEPGLPSTALHRLQDKASTELLRVGTGLDTRRWEISGCLPIMIADWRGDAYASAEEGTLFPRLSREIVTVERASSATITGSLGTLGTVVENEPAIDHSEGGRGLLLRSASGSRLADNVTLSAKPQCGAACIEFYPPHILRNDGQIQGLFCLRSEGFGRGVTAALQSDSGSLLLHLDDGSAEFRQDTRITLADGLNRLFLAWDLERGHVSFSLNGGVVKNFGPLSGWVPVMPSVCEIGRQTTTGGTPREFEGVIAAVAVYGRALRPPITSDGPIAMGIRRLTGIDTRMSTAPRTVRPLGDIYAEFITASPQALTVVGTNHVRATAKTGDHVAEGDAEANKVRCEFGDPVGWDNRSTLYTSFEILLPTLSLPGSWGLVFQGRQGGYAPGFYNQPPFALLLDNGRLEAVIRKPDLLDPTIARDAMRAELPVSAGQWARVDLYQQWDAGAGTGSCRLWIDGSQTVDYAGALGQNRPDPVRLTFGVYRSESSAEANGTEIRTFSAEFRNFRVSNSKFFGPWDV